MTASPYMTMHLVFFFPFFSFFGGSGLYWLLSYQGRPVALASFSRSVLCFWVKSRPATRRLDWLGWYVFNMVAVIYQRSPSLSSDDLWIEIVWVQTVSFRFIKLRRRCSKCTWVRKSVCVSYIADILPLSEDCQYLLLDILDYAATYELLGKYRKSERRTVEMLRDALWEKEDERCSNIPILDVESGGMCQEAHSLDSKCLQFKIEVRYFL